MCGEAAPRGSCRRHPTGPSPRVRGSHVVRTGRAARVRSIPACAGKPRGAAADAPIGQVHPRVCGEAAITPARVVHVPGPSPRVRGSRGVAGVAQRPEGSIPACAGKPPPPPAAAPGTRVHPRVCGEADLVASAAARLQGPSPRVRGSRRGRGAGPPAPGSIPACAGKPRSPGPTPSSSRVHPRVCGEAPPPRGRRARVRGPSPRVRGSPPPGCGGDVRGRSIPACAGKPSSSAVSARWRRVHPRVCGEATVAISPHTPSRGPSPRVRGSLSSQSQGSLCVRSIPACAGKPRSATRPISRARVHPRVCGEALWWWWLTPGRAGPSPRVRGSRRLPRAVAVLVGSIPACAGKPIGAGGGSSVAGVHPRVCGEAPATCPTCPTMRGPSPRVRGSLGDAVDATTRARSIPACAGKPGSGRRACVCRGVHPRVCGEALERQPTRKGFIGPSPRVRGSRHHGDQVRGERGSIPACAGKPASEPSMRRCSRVHPRVCGEARLMGKQEDKAPGPSPRVRGSPADVGSVRRGQGSIPACAGKPCGRQPAAGSTAVHPRVCGEARRITGLTRAGSGPSPRVRGSPIRRSDRPRWRGSIPACAGKPRRGDGRAPVVEVHPRVCGEAPDDAVRLCREVGPSPRVRGSRRHPGAVARRAGSIPACAGMPRRGRSRPRPGRVHPRVCGEAAALEPAGVVARGSIPACAGKPWRPARAGRGSWVHPRVCGEADAGDTTWSFRGGPSPRVRGSPAVEARRARLEGSIPACAGKPRIRACVRWASGVHPRVCGEAWVRLRRRGSGTGPSPRVRGSPVAVADPAVALGSIPACAGKPSRRPARPAAGRVHPRVCGEAPPSWWMRA